MGIIRFNGMLLIQLQCSDKGDLQFGKKMKGASQESNMPPDRLPAGQSADGLIHHRLENRCRKVFLGSPFVNERLDVGLGKYTASGGYGI